MGGSCLARGYLARRELTADRFIPNPFEQDGIGRLYRTGDLVRHLATERSSFWVVPIIRLSFVAFVLNWARSNRSGSTSRGGAGAVVVREDVPGTSGWSLILSVMVGTPARLESLAVSEQEIARLLSPSAYVSSDALALTPSGKEDRRGLPAGSGGQRESSERTLDHETRLRESMTEIWEELLGIGMDRSQGQLL